MTQLFLPWPALAAFLAASFILAITPGPGVLYIVTRSLTQGRRSGMASVAGVALGNLANAIGAAVGLAAWFSVSSLAFTVTKYAGAAYLVYLGLKTLFSQADQLDAVRSESQSVQRIFGNAFWVALLNPKTAIFFAAFLPQFMGAQSVSIQRSISLGCIFVLIAATTDTLYALAAGKIAPTLQREAGAKKIGRRTRAGVFLGLGLFTALAGTHRTTR